MYIVGTIKMQIDASQQITLDVVDVQIFDVLDHAQRYEQQLHDEYETPDIIGTVFIDRTGYDCGCNWEECRVTTIEEMCKK